MRREIRQENFTKIKKLNETVELMNYDIGMENEFIVTLSRILIEANITPMYKGYNYIIDGIRILCRNKYTHILITKDVYAPVACLYGTTPELVEHGIRTAIKKGWVKTDNLELKRSVYNSLEKCPTNYTFLASVASYTEERMRKG